jgi:hypothetical protein
MRVKSFKMLAIAAAVAFAGVANAATTDLVHVAPNSTFSDLLLGSITLSSDSNVTGSLGYVSNGVMSFFGQDFPVTFSSVSFSGGSIGSYSFVGSSFDFKNLVKGTYEIHASGSVASGAGGYIAAQYEVAAVPEPESYAMFLAGLGFIGAMVRRRSSRA